jgi:hypothetical protein
LRQLIQRDIADSAIESLSEDRRFATAYNAALQAAKMVIAACGYRVSGQGHHQTHFAVLQLAMGEVAANHAIFFDACRRKRNMVDYDMSGIVSRTELEQLIQETASFLELCENWISKNRPDLDT